MPAPGTPETRGGQMLTLAPAPLSQTSHADSAPRMELSLQLSIGGLTSLQKLTVMIRTGATYTPNLVL